MSEYQYYEFCKLNAPLTTDAKEEMRSLSSRAKITTHGASYVYNYSDFRGNPRKLLLKYFDVFFYISNWGSIQLIFKYLDEQVDIEKLKKFLVKDLISCKKHKQYLLLDINFYNEDGSSWVEGDDMLPDLLPLYDEIESGNYEFLRLVANIDAEVELKTSNKRKNVFKPSQAQKSFFKYADVDLKQLLKKL